LEDQPAPGFVSDVSQVICPPGSGQEIIIVTIAPAFAPVRFAF
jgi:hypothetical protein